MNKTKNVEIYTTPTCHFCHMAMEFFDAHGISYAQFDVASDVDARKKMIEMTGQLGVPVIVIDEQIIIGFDQDKVAELLEVQTI